MTDIFIRDANHPEDDAMLQALYSRDPQSVTKHLEKLAKVGTGKFMDEYYVGYNHKSIGDCGSVTLYIEYVSMLAAKAIQDSPLYNGQEASTRYIDMSKQPVLNPLGTPEGQAIQDKWMAFYNSSRERLIEHLREMHPRKDGEEARAYEKAIKARSFDVLRCFIPAGCTTFVSWHTTLRHAADRLELLRHYPLEEVRTLSLGIGKALQERYPNSFGHKIYPDTEAYHLSTGRTHLYDPADLPRHMICTASLDRKELARAEIKLRPPHTRLPHHLDEIGQVTYEFPLDFGSFRDLQRHRNGVCRMPLLSTRWGFHPWYLDQLPDDLRTKAEVLIHEQTQAIDKLDVGAVGKQHYIAMGYIVPCKVTRGLPGTLYLIELRTAKTVHPTMRKAAQQMASTLLAEYSEISLHADMSLDDWDVRRGTQDIVAR